MESVGAIHLLADDVRYFAVTQAHAVELGKGIDPNRACGIEDQNARTVFAPALHQQRIHLIGVRTFDIGRDFQRKVVRRLHFLADALIDEVSAGDVHHGPDNQPESDGNQS